MRTLLTIVFTLGCAIAATAGQDAALVKKGQDVYTAQKCQVCHSVAGKGGKASALDGVGAKLSADEIRQWIVAAPNMAEKAKANRKPPMKAYELPKEDLDALVVYLQSLKK
jgi:mono/diheme cytochrome c family protein